MLAVDQSRLTPSDRFYTPTLIRSDNERWENSCLRIFVSTIASKTRKLTSAAALSLSTASLDLKARLSRSYSTATTKRLLFRLTAFAKSQGGSRAHAPAA